MDDKTRSLIQLAAVIMLITGFVMDWYALKRCRIESAPRMPSFNPSDWRQRRAWFKDDRGFQRHQTAGWLMFFGGLLATITFAWR